MNRRSLILDKPRLAAPPLVPIRDASLFLDLDGTLLDLVDDPGAVVADEALRSLLVRLSARLDGRLAIVSGRSIAQMDAILGPAGQQLALSGSHGSEHRWRGVAAHPVRPATLDEASARFRDFADAHAGIIVEDKSYGTALHFRAAPELAPDAQALAAALADALGLQLQHGKDMIELRVAGGDKGKAVRMMMARAPMLGTLPWAFGDDETDETAFVVANELGGAGILVGCRAPTLARYALPDPAAMRAWLEALLA